MESTKEIIDNFLYPGCYEQWMEMKTKVKKLTNVYHRNENMIRTISGYYDVATIVKQDVHELNTIQKTVDQFINKVIYNEPINSKIVVDIIIIQEYTIQIVENELELINSIIIFHTWVTGLIALSLALLRQRAKRLTKLIKRLTTLLKIAEKQLTVAKIKAAVNTSCAVLTFLLPPVGLLTTLSLAGGQLVLDLATEGPSKSTLKEVGDKTAPAAEIIAEEISKVERYGQRTRIIAKGAGKFFSVTGFYFSADEVLTGYHNKEVIKRELRNAKHQYNKLLRDIRKFKPLLSRYKRRLAFFNNEYKKKMRNIQNLRSSKYQLLLLSVLLRSRT